MLALTVYTDCFILEPGKYHCPEHRLTGQLEEEKI